MGAGSRYRKESRRVRAPNLASHGARRAIEQSATELCEKFGVRAIDLSTQAVTSKLSCLEEICYKLCDFIRENLPHQDDNLIGPSKAPPVAALPGKRSHAL